LSYQFDLFRELVAKTILEDQGRGP
jgi:hypothetical protein